MAEPAGKIYYDTANLPRVRRRAHLEKPRGSFLEQLSYAVALVMFVLVSSFVLPRIHGLLFKQVGHVVPLVNFEQISELSVQIDKVLDLKSSADERFLAIVGQVINKGKVPLDNAVASVVIYSHEGEVLASEKGYLVSKFNERFDEWFSLTKRNRYPRILASAISDNLEPSKAVITPEEPMTFRLVLPVDKQFSAKPGQIIFVKILYLD